MKKALPILVSLVLPWSTQAQLIFHVFDPPPSKAPLAVNKMSNAYNYILFLGNGAMLYDINDDRAELPYHYFYQPHMIPDDSIDTMRDKIVAVPFEILVDTVNLVQIPYYPDVPLDLPGPEIMNWIERHRLMVDAYPVYIWNATDQVTSIPVEGVTTQMIQEARDADGNWRPIEYRVGSYCGNGMRDYILEPGYYVMTSIYKYTGDFETDLRVKFRRGDKVYYSNTFRGYINVKQFRHDEYFHEPENFLNH
jgi:hypothetical protein